MITISLTRIADSMTIDPDYTFGITVTPDEYSMLTVLYHYPRNFSL